MTLDSNPSFVHRHQKYLRLISRPGVLAISAGMHELYFCLHSSRSGDGKIQLVRYSGSNSQSSAMIEAFVFPQLFVNRLLYIAQVAWVSGYMEC